MSLRQEVDTITAIATPIGEGGISVIRISGPDALEVAEKGFRGRVSLRSVQSHTAHHGVFVNETGEPLDEVVALVFRSPHSYTGEDVVELSCHGGYFVTRRILESCVSFGARAAGPGEFTKRAFLNGRMDLAQAEAVADLIHARSDTARRSSLQQLTGLLSDQIRALRDSLTETIGLLELELDFAEEGYELADKGKVLSQINEVISELDQLISTYGVGRVYREGVRVVLAGAPNVGKSSLLNALLEENRAIVTDIPGTTRDVITESITIGGVLFSIADTAGIRTTHDPIEQEGVRRTDEKIDACDLLVLIFDASRPVEEDEMIQAKGLVQKMRGANRPCILAVNKIDIDAQNGYGIVGQFAESADLPIVRLSAKTGEGLRDLELALTDSALRAKAVIDEGGITITNSRHYSALLRAKESLLLALESLRENRSGEFVAVDLRAGLDSLGEIIGVVTTDDILNHIFSRFCIGK